MEKEKKKPLKELVADAKKTMAEIVNHLKAQVERLSKK